VDIQVNPEFAAEILVLLLVIHEGLQYQKRSTKRLSSLSVFFSRLSSVFVITFRCSFAYGVTSVSIPCPCFLLFENDGTIQKYSVQLASATLWLKKLNITKQQIFLFLYSFTCIFICPSYPPFFSSFLPSSPLH